MGLRSLQPALANAAARADGDERLVDVPASVQRIGVWIQEGRTARCTDGAGLQTIRVSEQEAVYELPATRVSEHEKLICVNAWIALRHILDHIEENQIIADAVAGEELIAVEVIALNESTREHRRKHSHMIFVGEFLRLRPLPRSFRPEALSL